MAEVVNLKAWIFRIALNVGRDMRSTAWRKRRKPLPEDENVIGANDASPDAEILHRERLALVRRALLDLRPEEQEIFLLRRTAR